MKRIYLLGISVALGLCGAMAACSGDDPTIPPGDATVGAGGTGGAGSGGGPTTTVGPGGSGGTGGGNPMPPMIGAQIDRFGRPAINTALNATFETDMTKKNMQKDAYNADSDPTKWVANYTAEFEKNLAILDSLDTVCGNQAFYDMSKMDASAYGTLASVLADDRLWINTANMCAGDVYLAVEADATGVLKNPLCGGRMLDFDVIDTSYTVLATGKLDSSLGDTIAKHSDYSTMFPYLGAPN